MSGKYFAASRSTIWRASLRTAALAVAILVGVAAESRATPILYTMQGRGTGTLNGTPFTDAFFTIAIGALTENIFDSDPSPNLVSVVPNAFAHLIITGFPLVNFVNPTMTLYSAYNPNNNVLGIEEVGAGGSTTGIYDIRLAVGSPIYPFDNSFGPVVGEELYIPGFAFATDHGPLIINSVVNGTFKAELGAPEPASLALLGLGTVGITILSRRRRC